MMAFGGRAGRGAQGCGGRGKGSALDAAREAAILTAAAFGAVPVDLEKSNRAGNAVVTLIFDLKMAQPVTIDRDLTEIKGERWVRRPSALAKAEGKRKFTETEWADEYDQPEDWAVCARRSRARRRPRRRTHLAQAARAAALGRATIRWFTLRGWLGS